jgi:hypothetical protein
MTVAENRGPLVGRAVEIEVLRTEVAAVRTGIPRIVVVQGVAGIGKTALIENVPAAEHGLALRDGAAEAADYQLMVVSAALGRLAQCAQLAAQYRN